MKKYTTDRFLVGSWVSFYSFERDSYEFQLDQMRRLGLNFNIFPAFFGPSMGDAALWDNVERQYAARDMYYLMNGNLTDEAREQGVSYAKGKTRCIGYHVIDEPEAHLLSEVGRVARAYHEADGTRYPFVNLLTSYSGEKRLGGSFYDYVCRYVREAGAESIEYISHDFYPFADPDRRHDALKIFADMDVLRRVALENGLRTHAFLQSSGWQGIRMPNVDEMRWNVYGYLAYGFKALSWFNLVCPGRSDHEGECFYESIIYRDGTIRDRARMEDFGRLNQEIHALGPTLMKLEARHVYHVLDNVSGVELLPRDFMIAPERSEDLMISHMETPDGEQTYVMLFNKWWDREVTLTFALRGVEQMYYVSYQDGGEQPMDVSGGALTVTFRPGEGRLYRVVRA